MNRIKELRLQYKISQKQLSEYLNIDRTSICKYETGKNSPSAEILAKLSDFFGVTIDFLLGRTDDPTPTPTPTTEGSQWIPIRGNIAAGMPLEAIEEAPDPTDLDKWEEISADTARRGKHIALRIKGSSMAPYMEAGDIAIIRVQPDAESGTIAAVFVNGDSATVKKIKKENGGIWLLPINPLFPNVFYSAEQVAGLPVRIVGIVVELRRKMIN